MPEFNVSLPCSVDADYGIALASTLEVTGEFTPEDIAPRDRYMRAEYPDSPATVDIDGITMVIGDTRISIPLDSEDLYGIEDAVLESLKADQLQAQYDAADWQGGGNE